MLSPSPALQKLVDGRDPILVVFDGTPDMKSMRPAVLVSGLIMDVMLIENLGRATLGQQSDAVPRQ